MRNIRIIFTLLPVLFYLIAGCRNKAASEGGEFYSTSDFMTVRKIDMHIHFNTDDTAFINLAKKDNFRLLDIVDDRPFGLPMEDQQNIALQLARQFPGQISFATTFKTGQWNDVNWEKQTLQYLENFISKGAIAVKIWKNIGMDLKDASGKFVMVDDPRLDPVYDLIVKKNIALIGHNGEPKDCWLPLDQMTVKGNKNYYSNHPGYHMFLHPEYPSYDDQINSRDRMLEKHPRMRFIGCHLGSLEWSLEEIALRLDKYPNMAVDLSRMANLHIHAFNDREKTREFFIRYRDRLIYGTDKSVNKTDNPENMKKNVHNSWLNDWKFLATDEMIRSANGEGEFRGLKLPSAVIDKIYRLNAEKWLKGI